MWLTSRTGYVDPMRILIVEDDPLLARTLELGLRVEFAVDVVHDGRTALERVRVYEYDVVVLDRDLPVVHGDDVCRQIVESRVGSRILMLTASSGGDATVDGLALGADDYVAKPFFFPELIARIHALARRVPTAVAPAIIRGTITMDVFRRRVFRSGREIRLTSRELAVLELLVRADGIPLSADDLLDGAWSLSEEGTVNAVRLVIASLRRKLGDPPIVRTEIGAGYTLEES
jgi:DNA-binding response OmpR family regulator